MASKDFADKLKSDPRKPTKEEPKNISSDETQQVATVEPKTVTNDIPIADTKTDNKVNDTYTDKYTHMYTDKLPTKETKSKRLNLLIYPSTHENLERLAEMQAIKVNELINRVLKEYTELEDSQKMIENHKKITKSKNKRV